MNVSLTNAAVAQTLGKDIVKPEKRCEWLEAEIAELRGAKGLRAVPSDQDAMIA